MLTKEELSKICRLAKIEIQEEQQDEFLNKFNTVLEWINKLQEIDISGVTLDEDDLSRYNHSRTDDVSVTNTTAEVLSNAKDVKFDMFSVPKVIE